MSPDLGADELLFEARDQLTRAELDLHVLTGAAVERLAVHAAGKVHDDEVAIGGRMALLRVRPALVRACETLNLVFDRLFVGFDGQALKLEVVDLRRRDLRERLKANLHLNVRARRVIVFERDFGLHRRTKLLLLQQLLDAGLDRIVKRIRLDGLAMHLAD